MTSQLLTPANQITILRMAFIPVFVILLLYHHLGWAFFVFLLAGISDGLDGLMARWLQQKTSLGALLDPIADKLLLTTAFVVLSIKDLDLPNLIPLWLTILVLSRDVVLLVSTLVILLITGHRNFPPSIFGKATTLIQIITLTLPLSELSSLSMMLISCCDPESMTTSQVHRPRPHCRGGRGEGILVIKWRIKWMFLTSLHHLAY